MFDQTKIPFAKCKAARLASTFIRGATGPRIGRWWGSGRINLINHRQTTVFTLPSPEQGAAPKPHHTTGIDGSSGNGPNTPPLQIPLRPRSAMNPSLSKFMLARTPKHILHPTPTMNTALHLNTGASMPALGLGTWQSAPGEVKKAVVHAIEAGYRHIDCAYCYQNEDEVGEALQDVISRGIVKREDLFITSKLWCTFHTRTEEGLQKSLDLLKTPYLDLFLMHWPVPMNPRGRPPRCRDTNWDQLTSIGNHPLFPKLPDGSRDIDHSTNHIQTWKSLEKLIQTHPEKVKAIGVANYSVKYLEKLLAQATIVPAVNQIENHPLLPQQEIVDFCKQKGILIIAYSPLGSTGSPLFKDEAVNEVAKKHNVGPGTVLLSYHRESLLPDVLSVAYTVSCPRLRRPRQICDARSHRREPQAHLARRFGHGEAGRHSQEARSYSFRVPALRR